MTYKNNLSKPFELKDFAACLSKCEVQDMGGLSKFKNSEHYHVKSGENAVKGVVELTFLETDGDYLFVLKLAKNRQSDWAVRLFQKIKDYANQEFLPYNS